MPKKLSESLHRRMKVATGRAREQVLDLHATHALELVEQARSAIPPSRAIRIYARLHRLGEADTRAIRHRVLTIVGREKPRGGRAGEGASWNGVEDTWDSVPSLVSRIRQRLRGRVHLDLRQWVEHHTARVEIALLHLHAEHAARFIELLKPSLSYAAAVELYCEQLEVPPTWLELLYFFAVDRLSHSPAGPVTRIAPAAAIEMMVGRRRRSLRLLEAEE